MEDFRETELAGRTPFNVPCIKAFSMNTFKYFILIFLTVFRWL